MNVAGLLKTAVVSVCVPVKVGLLIGALSAKLVLIVDILDVLAVVLTIKSAIWPGLSFKASANSFNVSNAPGAPPIISFTLVTILF